MASRALWVGRRPFPSVAAAKRALGWSDEETRDVRRRLAAGPFVKEGLRIVYAVRGRKLRQRGRGDMGCYVGKELRREIVDGAVCARCGGGGPLEVDHIVPLAIGGSSEPENLQALCADCHAAKSAAERPTTGASKPKPISIPGFGNFPSLHAAERATGIDRREIRKRRDEGTLHKFAEGRRKLTGVALMRPLYVDGSVHASRRHASRNLGIRKRMIDARIVAASRAWDLITFRESWRWSALEKELCESGPACFRCGGRARRAVHSEAWLDLRTSPFVLPVDPVCGKCERVIVALRKADVRKANLRWAISCLNPFPEITPEILAEERRLLTLPPTGRGNQVRYPVFVDGNLFSSASAAERIYANTKVGGLSDAFRRGRDHWKGLPIRLATDDDLPPGAPPIRRMRNFDSASLSIGRLDR